MKERQRIRIFERDGGLCQECGAAGSELDHVRPKSSLPGKRLRAQRDGDLNYTTLCTPCHRQKSSNMWRNPGPKQQPPRWGGL